MALLERAVHGTYLGGLLHEDVVLEDRCVAGECLRLVLFVRDLIVLVNEVQVPELVLGT